MNIDLQKYIDYLEKEKNYSPKTIAAYSKDVEEFLCFLSSEIGSSYLDVTYDEVRVWIVDMSEKGLSNRSINRKTSSLKSFYSFLFRLKLVEQNPLKLHKSLKVEKKIPIPFSVSEVRDVLSDIDGDNSFEELRDRVVVELLYGLGLRRAELIALTVDDLDFYNNIIKVTGKRNKVRLMPMVEEMKLLLNKYLSIREAVVLSCDLRELIITKSSKKVSEIFVYRLINGYFRDRSSKEKKSPHMLRHTFATHLLDNGADINAIKELLGHSSLSSTQVYAHSSLEKLKEVYKNAHPREKRK